MQRLYPFKVKRVRFDQDSAPLILAKKRIKRIGNLAIIRPNLNTVNLLIINLVQNIKRQIQEEVFVSRFTVLSLSNLGSANANLNGPNSISATRHHITRDHRTNTCRGARHYDVTGL